MSNPQPTAPHARAWKAGVTHIAAYLTCTLGQLVIRLIALSPFLYAAVTKGFLGAPREHAAGIALLCCIPLWLLLVLPMRYRAGGRIGEWLSVPAPRRELSAFGSWLKQGLGRLVKVLPFLLPLLAWLGAFYYYMNFVDFPTFFLMIKSVGELVGGDYVHGFALLMVLLLVCAVIAYIGWRRMMVFFYLPEAPLSQDGARRKVLDWKALNRVTWINFLVVLPALGLSIALLASSLITRMTGDMQFDLMILLPAVTEFDFPQQDLLRVAAVLVVLYLPFVVWRKAALSAAMHGAPRA